MIKCIIILQTCVLFALCISCKKNTVSAIPTPTQPVNTINNGFYGYISLSDFTWKQYSTTILNGNANVEFNDVSYDNTGVYIAPKDAGNVLINGVQLRRNFSSFVTDYEDSTQIIFTSPFTINTTGSSYIPSFTLSINNPYPSFSNFTLLTDTLVKSQGFNFTVTNIANADSLFAFIQPLPYYKHIAINGQTNITINFTPAELAVLNLSYPKTISFHFYKYDTVYQNNKPYSVTLLKGYSKDVFIKN